VQSNCLILSPFNADNYRKNMIQLFVCLSVDLDMAIAYWNIVLHDKFKFLDLWSRYLVVSALGL